MSLRRPDNIDSLFSDEKNLSEINSFMLSLASSSFHFRTNPEQQEKNELKERFPIENLKKLPAQSQEELEYLSLPTL